MADGIYFESLTIVNKKTKQVTTDNVHLLPRGEILPCMGYIGMCGPKGYGFSAVLVINRVSNLADSGHK